MTDEVPAVPQQPSRSRTMALASIATLLALLHFGGPGGEGYKHKPYRDVGGVWTACGGLTGPDIHPGHEYSDAECTQLETAFAVKMAAHMGPCTPELGLTQRQWIAWGHWSWNIGAGGFCKSRAAQLLWENKQQEACAAMMDYHRAGGRDCRIRSNGCPGLIVRRRYEIKLCQLANPT